MTDLRRQCRGDERGDEEESAQDESAERDAAIIAPGDPDRSPARYSNHASQGQSPDASLSRSSGRHPLGHTVGDPDPCLIPLG